MPTYKHSYLPNIYFFYGSNEEFRNLIVKAWYRSKKDTYLFDHSFPRNIYGTLPSEIKVVKSILTGNRMWGLDRNSICFINFLPLKQFMNVVTEGFYPRCSLIYRTELSNFILLLQKKKLRIETNNKLEFFKNYL